jgi:hypothetical protein
MFEAISTPEEEDGGRRMGRGRVLLWSVLTNLSNVNVNEHGFKESN